MSWWLCLLQPTIATTVATTATARQTAAKIAATGAEPGDRESVYKLACFQVNRASLIKNNEVSIYLNSKRKVSEILGTTQLCRFVQRDLDLCYGV